LVYADDSLAPFSDAYTITSATLSRIIFGGLTYSGLAGLILFAETGSNTITVSSTAAGTPVTVYGEGGNDNLVGPNTTNTWNITSADSGTVGNVTFYGIPNLTGGTANDTFKFAGGSLSGGLNGGGGNDTVVGPNTNNTWNITGTNAGTL